MVIMFSNEKARTHLLKTGVVYTFRKNRRKQFEKMSIEKQMCRTGIIDWATDHRGGKKLVDVIVHEFGPFNDPPGPFDVEDIKPYVRWSGFSSFKEWFDVILQFSPEMLYTKGWLYKVSTYKQTKRM